MVNVEVVLNNIEELKMKILLDVNPKYLENNQEKIDKALKDIDWSLRFFTDAYRVDNTQILESFFLWLAKTFDHIGLNKESAKTVFKSMKKIVLNEYPDKQLELFFSKVTISTDYNVINYVNESKYPEKTKEYLEAMLSGNKEKAMAVIHGMLQNGTPIEDIYTEVFQFSLYEVGNLWQQSKITVAKEHYCTALTQYVMATLYSNIFNNKKYEHKLLATAVGSELHEIGIRMVADLFEQSGWDTSYLGANLPKRDFILFAHQYNPDVIALSITMPYHLNILQEYIRLIREDDLLKNKKILVGGKPFLDNQDLYLKVGADGYALNAKEAIKLGESLVG